MRRIPAGILAVGMATAFLSACGQEGSPNESPDASVDVGTFPIPTWEWARGDAMAAEVSGRLAIAPDGCTLMFSDDDSLAQPVMFPNAVGMEFANGVRAVVEERSGKVYAVEGQEFSYGGGWIRPGSDWTDQRGSYEPDDIAYVNDLPAFDVPSADPTPYPGELPSEIPSSDERGWYEVPTFTWDPEDGGDGALLEGTIRMTDDGCAVVTWIRPSPSSS